MIKMKQWLIILLYIMPASSFAFFCPTNFNQISAGDTIEQVTQQCGKPDKQETKEQNAEGPQEWSYYIPQTVSTQALKPEQGTLKTQVTFDSSGKAINISVNGIGVGSTSICGNPIRLGDTRDTVKATCGDPSFLDRQNGPSPALGPQQPSVTITTFTYNSNPPVTLKFENDRLIEQ